jgi:hypothetical protein
MGKAARETSLENLGLKSPYFQMMFEPSDFIVILVLTVFKVVRVFI